MKINLSNIHATGNGLLACVLSFGLLFPQAAFASGPIGVGGPGLGVDGEPLTWDLDHLAGGAIQYRVDPGPLSKQPDGTVVIDNAAGVARVQGMFANWAAVPTSRVAFQSAG